MSEFYGQTTGLYSLAGIVLSAFVGWIFSRQSTKAEVNKKNTEIEQMKAEVSKTKADSSMQIMNQYQEALDDLKQRYEDRYDYLRKEFERRHEDVKADYESKYKAAQTNFEHQIKTIRQEKDTEIEALKKTLENLSRKLDYWKKKYKELEK